MSYLSAILLGALQGVAEFLPLSSSGHLSVFQNLFNFGYSENEHMLFDVLLHLGTFIAVFIAYRKEIIAIIRDTIDFFRKPQELPAEETVPKKPTSKVRELLFLAIGSLPLFLVVPFFDAIEQLYYNTKFIAAAFIVTGLILFASDKIQRGKKNEKNMSVLDVLIVGLGQAVATLPGISRSGTTISLGLMRGFRRDFAVRYAFLLSIPAVLASNFLTLFKAIKAGIDFSLMPVYLVGVLTAGLVGYLCIFLVKRLVNNDKFGKFAYYCWGAGFATLVLSFIL